MPDKYRLAGYDETYDFHTIAYDVIWVEQRKSLLFICPKLLNLERIFKSASITAYGVSLSRHRIRRYRRHDEVWIKCDRRPEGIKLTFNEFILNVNVSPQEHVFENKNVLMTKSKDNDLVWISDWLTHHAKDQSANAALIFDNDSREYPLSDLQQTMENVDGIEVAHAIASNFPFGSWKARKLLHRSMFYQAAMLAITRYRFLHCARAVLPIDIDELVCGANVFDAAVNTRFGYVTVGCSWRYSKLANDQIPLHRDHIWRQEPDAPCKEKYCLSPGRWFTDTTWDIHGLHRYAFNRVMKIADAHILHCEHVSNGWKRNRRADDGKTLVLDQKSKFDLRHLR